MGCKESGLFLMNFNIEAYRSNFDLVEHKNNNQKTCVEMGGGRTFQILSPGQQS